MAKDFSRPSSGDYHAIVLAAAGLQRLQLQQYIQQLFSIEQTVPATDWLQQISQGLAS